MTETTYLEIAAHLMGISPRQLWDYREGLAGISVRTPDGYRHTYRFDELERAMPDIDSSQVEAACFPALADMGQV